MPTRPPRASSTSCTATLVEETLRCLRPPVDRFAYPWLAPMPLSPSSRAYLEDRAQQRHRGTPPPSALAQPGEGDRFKVGDYSLGLFHHDASEAAIELVRHRRFLDAIAGSLLCFLDCASPDGRVHRIELSHKAREAEPAKPVMAQFALRVARGFERLEGAGAGHRWLRQHEVYPRVLAFLDHLDRHYTGLHGLPLTHSALGSGFDSDLLTATLHDRTVEGPDTAAFTVLEWRAAAELAKLLGRPDEEAARHRRRADQLARLVEMLMWYEDDDSGYYVALRWEHGVGSLEGEVIGMKDPDGVHRPLESWTTLLPLYAGIPSPGRAEALVARLLDPARYWGPWGVRTAPRTSVFYSQAPRVMLYDHKKNGRGPVSNWTGPIWVLSNYYMAQGLARYGHHDGARDLALRTARLLAGSLERDGKLYENWDDQGQGLWPCGDHGFLSWNVLALTLLREHVPQATEHWEKIDNGLV